MSNIFDDTKVTIKRGGSTLVSHVPIQIDEASTRESAYVQSDTYFGYDCMITNASTYGLGTTIKLAVGDLLVDEKSTLQYRIKNIPIYLAALNFYQIAADLHTGVAS